MISQTLRDARRYEDAMAQNITSIIHMIPSGDQCTGDMR